VLNLHKNVPTQKQRNWPVTRVAVLLFSLIGCGADPENLTKKEELDDRASLHENLQPVLGTYEGMIEERPDGSDPFPIELTVFLIEEEDGINQEGEIRFRPSLRARYRRRDLLNEGLGERTLRVRFYRERSEIAGTTSTSTQVAGMLPNSQLLSFTGLAKTDQLDLEFQDHRGVLGYALLKRINP
jgi:hypothetical protein